LRLKKRFSILFVCTGNTCRSPLAEVIMKRVLRDEGIRNVNVSSAGTSAVEGGRVSENASLAARELGLSLSGFRSRPLSPRRVHGADLILTMTRSHMEEITKRWPEAEDKTFVIGDYSGSGRRSIHDPLGGSEKDYTECAEVLSYETAAVLRRLKSRLRSGRSGA
jgi:protein-tyrosine-phosphatase